MSPLSTSRRPPIRGAKLSYRLPRGGSASGEVGEPDKVVDEDHEAGAEEGVRRQRDKRPGRREVRQVDEVAEDRESDTWQWETVE